MTPAHDVESLTREYANRCVSAKFSEYATYSSALNDGDASIGRLSLKDTSGIGNVFMVWSTPKIQRPLCWMSEGYAAVNVMGLDSVRDFVKEKILKREGGHYEVIGTSTPVGSDVVVRSAFSGKEYPSPFERAYVLWLFVHDCGCSFAA